MNQTKTLARCLLSLCLAAVPTLATLAEVDPWDWPNWRGPRQNSTSSETNLPVEWDPAGGPGSNLLWKSEKLATRSTPVILAGKLYTITRNHQSTPIDGEKVVCADAATGEILWEHTFNVYLSEVPDFRVGWSSCVVDPETGHVYALGVCGYFVCLEGDSGEVVWKRSLHEELGLLSTYGGRTNFPLIFEDTVIISAVVIGWGDTPEWGLMAKPAHRFLCFNKATGDLRWLSGTSLIPYDTTYSTPTIAEVNGKMQMIFGSGDGGIWSLEPRTGRRVWTFPFSRRGINSSPLVVGDTVFASHSEENRAGTAMGGLVALDASQLVGEHEGVPVPKVSWRKYQVMVGKSSPVMLNDRLYLVDDGAKLRMFDPQTGRPVGRPPRLRGTAMWATPLVADGKLYLATRNASCYVLEPTSRGVKILHDVGLDNQQIHASTIASHGRIYISTTEAIYCIGSEQSAVSTAPSRQPIAEVRVSAAAKATTAGTGDVAHVQVIPHDALLQPGGQQEYRVRLYDDRGEFLREAAAGEAQFSVSGAGQIASDGKYTAPEDAEHVAALVRCNVGQHRGQARIRIVPPLPWEWSFDGLDDVPLTWVGGRVRYVLRDVDGQAIMVKLSELPTRPGMPPTKLGTKSRMWMGPTELSNYTVQADIQLTETGGKMPDAGIINSCYTLVLMGESQRLHLRTWDASDFRAQADLPMELEPGVWYTVQCRVEQEDDHARVLGKIFKRGEAEPEAWSLELKDSAPNRQGSPGLFGISSEAEIFLDNLRVTPNDG